MLAESRLNLSRESIAALACNHLSSSMDRVIEEEEFRLIEGL